MENSDKATGLAVQHFANEIIHGATGLCFDDRSQVLGRDIHLPGIKRNGMFRFVMEHE